MAKIISGIIGLFGSAGFAIITFILIILASAAGTFIPQDLMMYEYIQKYGRAFEWLIKFQLIGIYQSWWFIGLLSLFGLSLLVCTFKKVSAWRKKYAFFITHVGLLVILTGALASCLWQEKGFLSLNKGHPQDSFLSNGYILKKLGFSVLLEDFSLERHDSGQVKAFKSKVTISEKGRVALSRTIEVNRPLKFKGYALSQVSYNPKRPDWTGLEVARDPGLPLVYGGFILLNIGVIINSCLKPKTNKGLCP